MDSTDRKETFVFSALFATVVAVIFMVSGCVIQEQRANAPVQIVEAKSEHILKVYCVRNRGDWTTKDTNGYNVAGHCNFQPVK